MVAEIAEGMVAPIDLTRQPTLLDKMIRAGIKQYFMQQLLPHTPDSLRLSYSARQMEWANLYEARIYKELIPHLYKIDFNLHRDFMAEKPYTTQLSLDSAPRVGEFAGWKMVAAYMRLHPEENLESLTERQDYETIFKESRYKP